MLIFCDLVAKNAANSHYMNRAIHKKPPGWTGSQRWSLAASVAALAPSREIQHGPHVDVRLRIEFRRKERHGFARGIVRTRLVDAHDEGGKKVFSLRELPCPCLHCSSRSEAAEGSLGKAGSRKCAGATSITGGLTWRSTSLVAGTRYAGAPSRRPDRHNCGATTEGASFRYGHSWPHPRGKAAL